MSRRPGIELTHTADTDPTPHNSQYHQKVSVHLRVYWPPGGIDRSDLREEMLLAVEKAMKEIDSKFASTEVIR